MAKQHQKPAERPADYHVAVDHLPLISLSHSPTNPRKTYPERELNELAQSIRDNGIINPITVRPIFEEIPSNRSLPVGIIGYEVVAGNRRFRAAQIAESEAVPCIVRDLTDEQVMDIQIVAV